MLTLSFWKLYSNSFILFPCTTPWDCRKYTALALWRSNWSIQRDFYENEVIMILTKLLKIFFSHLLGSSTRPSWIQKHDRSSSWPYHQWSSPHHWNKIKLRKFLINVFIYLKHEPPHPSSAPSPQPPSSSKTQFTIYKSFIFHLILWLSCFFKSLPKRTLLLIMNNGYLGWTM